MCFGYDGDAALRESLERKGASRRGLLRGAVAGAAGATVLAAGSPALASKPSHHPGKGHGHGHGRQKEVPTDLISIQLYTLRDAMTDRAAILRQFDQLAKFGYQRVERAGLYPAATGLDTAAKLKAELDARGIWASSSHDGISTVDKGTDLDPAKLNKKLDDAQTFRQKYIVVPYLTSNTKSDWQRWAEQMNIEARAARRRGLRYGYHNHAHEFTIDLGGGVTPWDILTSELDPRLVHLEIDLYWAYTGGVNTGAADPLQFAIDVIRSAPQEVRQYHVKDRHGPDAAVLFDGEQPGDMADLGLGVIDFPTIFKAHQVEEYIVENDSPDFSPAATANTGFRYLEGLEF